MSASRPTVHPTQPPPPHPLEDVNAAPFGVPMKNTQGMPGTLGGLGLRLAQASFAAASTAVMASAHVFPSVSAFRCHPFSCPHCVDYAYISQSSRDSM